jgi:hypothetical protein
MRKKFSSKTEETADLDEQGEASIESAEEAAANKDEEAKGNIVSQAVYTTFYAVSFGVVFSSLLLSKLLVPKNGVVAKGLHDGSIAARKALVEKEILFAEVAEQTAELLSGEEPTAEPGV